MGFSQTCGRSATVRPERTLDRRMVTAAKPVYSAWFSTKRRSHGNDTTHWSGSAPELLHGLYSARERKELRDRMEIGTIAEIRSQAAVKRRDRGRGDGQHAAVPRRGGAACEARGGGQRQSVQSHHALSEEDRSQRCAQPGAVFGQGSAAGGALEG